MILHIPMLNILRNLRSLRKTPKAWEGWYDAALETRRKVRSVATLCLSVEVLTQVDAN
jgi:hypothetical protein